MNTTKSKPLKPAAKIKKNSKADWPQLQYRVHRETKNALKAAAALSGQNTEDFLDELIRREVARRGIKI